MAHLDLKMPHTLLQKLQRSLDKIQDMNLKVELTGIDNKKYVYKKGDFTRFENTLVLKKPFVTKNNH